MYLTEYKSWITYNVPDLGITLIILYLLIVSKYYSLTDLFVKCSRYIYTYVITNSVVPKQNVVGT